MKLGKRTLAVGALLIAFAAVMATQYATVRVQATAILTGKYPWIEFMAHDKNATDGQWLLRRNGDNANYTLHIGDLSSGQIKIWTAAFAIVNTEQHYKLRITGVSLWGTNAKLLKYINITLHHNPDAVGNVSGSGYQPPSDAHWTTDKNAKIYWYDGASVDHSSDGWVLGVGNGYDKTNTILYYGNASGWAKAQYDGTYHVYNYTTTNTNNLPTDGTDNYVWVQIIIDLSKVDDISKVGTGSVTLYMEFFFEGIEA